MKKHRIFPFVIRLSKNIVVALTAYLFSILCAVYVLPLLSSMIAGATGVVSLAASEEASMLTLLMFWGFPVLLVTLLLVALIIVLIRSLYRVMTRKVDKLIAAHDAKVGDSDMKIVDEKKSVKARKLS